MDLKSQGVLFGLQCQVFKILTESTMHWEIFLFKNLDFQLVWLLDFCRVEDPWHLVDSLGYQ